MVDPSLISTLDSAKSEQNGAQIYEELEVLLEKPHGGVVVCVVRPYWEGAFDSEPYL